MTANESMTEVMRLAIANDLTIYHAIEMKQQLLDALRHTKVLELDLSQVGEIDTSGFQLLVLAKRESIVLGHNLRLVAHSPAVREVIDFYNMQSYFGDPVVIPAGDATGQGG